MRSAICLGLAAFLFGAGAYAQQTSSQLADGSGASGSSAPAASAPAASAPAASGSAAGSAADSSQSSQDDSRPHFGKPNDDSSASTKPDSAQDSSAKQGDSKSVDVSTKGDDKGKKSDKNAKDDKSKNAKDASTTAQTDVLPQPGEALDPHIKAGSEDDVNAIGTRNIGGRGMGNWYSTNWEIGTGKQYSMEIEKSAHLVTDPVIVEYVNRVGQNIVKNSDCKVPFTIKIIDSDEINAMALPGGFFYVNSGLIMAADEEAELAGVMAHETAHVCAHHAARQQTKMNYIQLSSIPLIIFTQGSWTGYGIYEASQLAIPITFLSFSRGDEAEADWLGLQYMYKAGYDPQAFIQFFEKIDALEKHKPGTLAKVFADHPQTPDRIAHSEEEIATIMPAKPDYIVTTSEFDDVKTRLARLENKRKLNDKSGGTKPTLRRAGGSNNDPNSPTGSSTSDDRPTLGRRD